MNSSDAVVLLQARMASTRLPGKALASLAGRTVLSLCLERLGFRSPAPVILATTTNPEDDALAAEASRLGAGVFRGPDADVLRRYLEAARAARVRYVVRATGDNPAVDADAPLRVLRAIRETGVDHVVEVDLPYGSAVEAVTTAALERAHEMAADPFDREHVTTVIRRKSSVFTALCLPAPPPVKRPDLRFTVDTADDLDYMRRVMDAVTEPDRAPLHAIVAAADALALENDRESSGASKR